MHEKLIASNGPTIGMWMYQNSGGEQIQNKMISKLAERGINVITGLDLAHASAQNGEIVCNGVTMEQLDLFFSYNAGEQTAYQLYLYEAINKLVPTINNFDAFSLSEDKFLTAYALNQAGIRSPDYRVFSRDDISGLRETVREWDGRVVYKPTDGWGGTGIVKIEDERSLDVLVPFLNRLDVPHFYLEKYINYDKTDFRVDIVDGQYIGCYGRKAASDSWKTNITSGGSVITRHPTDEVIELAIQAAKVTGLEIAGVDLIFDLDAEEYVVLEVNGIPAFATPDQEILGINFNQKKIDTIVELIEKTVSVQPQPLPLLDRIEDSIYEQQQRT